MGRINNTGNGWGCNPKGYYLRLYASGDCALFAANQATNGAPGKVLATGKAADFKPQPWHNLKLQFSGATLTGFVDNQRVLTAKDTTYASGLAGLVTGGDNDARNTALFDDLIINTVNGENPKPTVFPAGIEPMYKP